MTLSAEQRRAMTLLKRQLREITAPERQERKAREKIARKQRSQALKASRAPSKRQERERDNGYLAWVRRLPCVAGLVAGGCEGPVEAAHLRFSDAKRGRINPGTGRKPSDRYATPLCRLHHHHDQHRRNERAFWTGLGIDAGELTDALYAAYRAGEDGSAVLRSLTDADHG